MNRTCKDEAKHTQKMHKILFNTCICKTDCETREVRRVSLFIGKCMRSDSLIKNVQIKKTKKTKQKRRVDFHLLARHNSKKEEGGKKRKSIWDKSAWKGKLLAAERLPEEPESQFVWRIIPGRGGREKFRQVSSHRASLSSSRCQRETLGSEQQLQLKLRRPELPKSRGCLRLISIP